MTHHFQFSATWIAKRLLVVTVTLLLGNVVSAQTAKKAPGTAPEESPVFQEYRGIQIGWLADEVRKKLGNPADKGDEQDFYRFGDNEQAQIVYDKDTHKVTTISVDFMNGAKDVITPQQVFGADFETKADGSKHKLVRYPKAGYWVSYSRTAGDSPIITVTMQSLH
jgi:hypothetical protein